MKAELEAKMKAEEEEAEAAAEAEAQKKAEVEAKMKAELEAKMKAEEEAEAAAEAEAQKKAEEEAAGKEAAEASAKGGEEARIKAELEERLKAEAEAAKPGGDSRISELERLEREFGLEFSDEVFEPLASTAKNQFSESGRIDSIPYDEGVNRSVDKIEQKFDLIQKQQTEVTTRLLKLERLKERGLKSVEEKDAEDFEESLIDQIPSVESRVVDEVIQERDVRQMEESDTPPGHNLVDANLRKEAETVTESDDVFIPSKKALASTPLLMKEVSGVSLENYIGREGVFSERDVKVHAGNTLKVPVRITTPGSIVEFSIEKKSYDFSFGINAFLDGGQVAKIKVCSYENSWCFNGRATDQNIKDVRPF